MLQLTKIISGGQTGVDQAALRAAMKLGLEFGGWCPPDGRSDEGLIPAQFCLRPTPEERSLRALGVPRSLRTEWNARDADATLVLTPMKEIDDCGTAWTLQAASWYNKPSLVLNPSLEEQSTCLADWLQRNTVSCLNVGGPSEQDCAGVGALAYHFLIRALSNLC